MQVKRLFYGVRGSFNLCEDTVRWAYMLTEKAKHKAKALVFWEKRGLSAARDACSVKRSTLFLWKKQLKDNKGVVEALNEKSKRPPRKKQRTINPKQELFILNLRKEHLRIGKDKLIDWLLWYNTQRPRRSLKQIPPLRHILNTLFLTPQKSNVLWTHTGG